MTSLLVINCAGHVEEFTQQTSSVASNAGAGEPNALSATTAAPGHLPALQACTTAGTPAPRQLRRLTVTELTNTLVDVFADPNVPIPTNIFDDDPQAYTFKNVAAYLAVDDTGAAQVQSMAEAIASYATTNAAKLSTCQTTDATCETTFINQFGAKVFRAPLSNAQTQAYLTLMQSVPTFANALGTVVDAMLQSPYFLYRSELGTAASNGTFTLTPYEIASELSYTFTSSMPDATLMTAANQGMLSSAEQIAAQATRLMQTQRAHATLDEFFIEWFNVADLPNDARTQGNTTLSPDIAQAMLQETTTTIDTLLFNPNSSFSDLHTLTSTYVNNSLAQFYGLSNPPSGSAFVQTPLGNSRDPGILFQGGVLSATSEVNLPSPVLRGRFLREHILCQTIAPPPANLKGAATPPANDLPNETTRQTYAAHITSAVCASCHTMMDPMAYTEGDYDTLGRRFAGDLENGQPIDTTGEITSLENNVPTVTLSNAAALSQFVAQSPQAAACMARHWTMYGLGNIDFAQDGCTFDAVSTTAAASSYNLQKTLLALTQVPSFTVRSMDP